MNSPYGYSPGGGQPPGYNPYAAPGAPQYGGGFRPPAGAVAYQAHGGALKWIYLACLLGGYAVMALGGLFASTSRHNEDVGAAIAVLGFFVAFFARLVVGLIWIYSAWSAIPADYRITSTGKRVSPGEAVGFLFIPFFNLYWMFVASGGLCDALDYLLRSAGSTRTAPKGLSLGACICQFVPYVNLLVAPFLWFFFMLSVDSTARDLQAAAASGGAGAPQGFGGGYGGPAGGYGGPPAGGYGAPQAGYGGAGYGPPR